MRKNLIVGILKETKQWEYRAPLVPSDVRWLVKLGVGVEVESSPERIFRDQEYKKSGARIVNKIQKASFLVGIKEPQVADLCPDTIYMIFSHTIKGQFKNMPLLKACLKKKIVLIDYEKIVDSRGKRLVYFGRFAGICGAIDSLHYLGKKLEYRGFNNPFSIIQPAHKYISLKAAKKDLELVRQKIRQQGFREELSPFLIGVTGHGSVSRGVQEVLELLNPIEIHPKDILRFIHHQRKKYHRLYKIVFFREEKLRAKNGKGFYFEEYLNNPGQFESNLDKYVPYLNMLIHTSYWDKRFPRMVTKKMIHNLAKKKVFRLEFIGDLSCDINGSIELTYRATTPEAPTFTYIPQKKKFVDGYNSSGVTVLAVDNLPAQLPRDSSTEFSGFIREYVYQIATQGVKDITQHMALPREIRRAVITEAGRLTRDFSYLKDIFTSGESQE
ncbi:MAG: hypothetical protein NG737_05165 [Omnitrophica bacterium]|nr:hypothetical protein [Candidatus Omnitrophota bacterium]